MGGAHPPTEPLPGLYSPPKRTKAVRIQENHPFGANPKGQPFGGCFPSNPPQDGPPNLGLGFARSTSRSLPIFTDFSDFLGITSSRSRVLFTSLLVHMYVFFSDDVLWRNYFIRSIELFEPSPILLLPRCLGAC